MVLFPAADNLSDLADRAVRNYLLYLVGVLTYAALVRDRYLRARAFAGCDHRVGLRQGWRERLFTENAAHAGLGRRDHHVMLLVHPARRHADDVQLFLLQHLAVVPVAVPALHVEAFACGLQSCRVRVRDRRQVDLLHAQVDRVQAVAVIAAACVADDAGSVSCHVNSSSLTI